MKDIDIKFVKDDIMSKNDIKFDTFECICKCEFHTINEYDSHKKECKDIIIQELQRQIHTKIINNEQKEKPKYKHKLNSVLRFAVWNNIIGSKVAAHKCLCCNNNEISQQNFQCGHVVSRHNGGEDIIDNLVPICGSCNSSMGSTNMDSFIKILQTGSE